MIFYNPAFKLSESQRPIPLHQPRPIRALNVREFQAAFLAELDEEDSTWVESEELDGLDDDDVSMMSVRSGLLPLS